MKNNYSPIEDHGLIGDLNTAALVSTNGTIDFLCFPDFDSPSIFASLLDQERGGYFKIHPCKTDWNTKQLYFPDTNVLLTRFLSGDGVGEIIDFMPVALLNDTHVLIRRVICVTNEIKFSVDFKPRFNYGRSAHNSEAKENRIVFSSRGEDATALSLFSSVQLEMNNGDAGGEFTLKQGESAEFIVQLESKDSLEINDAKLYVDIKLDETMDYWKKWISKSKYSGRWLESVNRSALTLKLLTSHKYGSIIASPTFGLPAPIHGERNWDYRYTWLRDASFTIFAFINLGFEDEAKSFIDWFENKCEDTRPDGSLGLMYKITGEEVPEETILSHLRGYRDSTPVRIGNRAKGQLQLDIYGELIDAIYLYNKYSEPISYSLWLNLNGHLNWLKNHWQDADEGIWEVRGGKYDFLYSKFMCWVAFDRAIKMGEHRSWPVPAEWKKVRDDIFKYIYANFWNNNKKTFVQYKGAKHVDGSLLLMPIIRFISPFDPMWRETLNTIENEIVADSLVYRYRLPENNFDGLSGQEGTFSVCTFWYIESLVRGGQMNRAIYYFDKMLAYGNHVGLFSEQLELSGKHLGNFPQALTHLGLISAALAITRRAYEDEDFKIQN